jgi:membrane-associated phospholipid phosphatase
MNILVVAGLTLACGVMMIVERLGVPTTLQLSFRGDVKRETQWLAQYGQFVCTIAAAALIWQLDPADREFVVPLCIAVGSTSLSAFLLKRLFGRVRPKRDNAGRFLGPTWKHDNHHESFPSSHSACAVALTVGLSHLYPQAAAVFWTLAIITAVLRYVLDAHWPSDVVGGITLGYVLAWSVLHAFGK